MKIKENKDKPQGQTNISFFIENKNDYDRREIMKNAPSGFENFKFTRTSKISKQILSPKYRKLLNLLKGNPARVSEIANYMGISNKVAYADVLYLEMFGLLRRVKRE